MARQAASMKKTRTRYSQAYKDEALALANRVGTSAAARELGLQPSHEVTPSRAAQAIVQRSGG